MAVTQPSIEGESDAGAPPSQLATTSETPPMKCCCGSAECIFLRHNYLLLENLEKDVHQAARMGQALLARHESYMADAERDRNELTARIEQLEKDNKELETINTRTIEENRELLDQLEALNSTVVESESQIKSLEATLLSSQQTIRRLEAETARCEALERQIAALEQEQAELQGTLTSSREEARSAVSRWKRAERGINDLQEQLERIEKEAKAEREHHEEMMGRIEKQREVERELNTAAGRLKGAAAAKSMNHGGNGNGNGGSNVVGHFVRDLLQDNANLQYGIAELRQMLMNSHDEIQALRDQLEFHQPFGDHQEGSTTPTTLKTELGPEASPVRERQRTPPLVSQALHIHHHYHVAAPKQEPRRPKKKNRPGLVSSLYTPSLPLPNTPPNGLVRHSRKDSMRSGRWSVMSEQGASSEFAPSSAPSSPRSNTRNSSVFDPPVTTDSFPGSPISSIDPISPTWRAPPPPPHPHSHPHPHHKRQPSSVSTRSFQAPMCFPFGPALPTIAHPIAEESEATTAMMEGYPPAEDEEEASSPRPDESTDSESITSRNRRPPLRRRAMSHESIVSLPGGLDIHTLSSRPSQQLAAIRQLGSASSVTGSSIVTARPLLSRDQAKRSSMLLRDSYALHSPVGSLQSSSSGVPPQQNETHKLGRWTAWRPWGGGARSVSATRDPNLSSSSSASPPNLGVHNNDGGAGPGGGALNMARSVSVSSSRTTTTTSTTTSSIPVIKTTTTPSIKSCTSEKKDTSAVGSVAKTATRLPGINQPGPIPGFSEFLLAAQKKKKAPVAKTVPENVDLEALAAGLRE
ncbi:hypothetical protein F5Y17DRAFT_451847 [Xylariaceae sp. FL0594]|nr:hypothetical protein F5Y17DRAFT_451847 [Xylariaceae sp. FL0594]